MARGDTAQAKINVTTNAQAAKNDIEDINNLLKKLQKTKQMMMKEGLHLTADGKETATFKKLNRDIKDAQQSLKRMVDSQTLMNKTMDNLKDIRLKELKRRYRELTKELGNFTGREKQASKQWRDNLEKIKAQISAIEGAGKGASKSFMSFGGSLKTTMKNLVAYAGVFAMFNRTKEKLSEIVKLNKEFSDQLANIRKVSNLPMDSINELATNLAKIDTRSSVQQLNELAYTGAKLGFGTLGTDALEGFVKSAVVVQNALSEDMGADAMTALSKMVEVMGLIPKLGVEKAMNSVGSAIFKLASTSTATGTNIVEFSKRLMGLANQAGITADELLAIGSAADSMALMPEVAATAFNKLITSVQKQPNLIENALHIEPGTISQMYQAGKMTDALVLIFDKMREKGGMNALMQSGVFKDLGSDGARLVAVMATMSNRVDMLKEHLETARDAFAEGTAVGQEYAIQMETAEAYSERAANMWTKAFVNPEGVNVVKSLTKAWYDMTVQLTQSESVMTSVKFLLEGLVSILKVFISILPGLLSSLVAFSGIKGLMMVYNSLFAVEGMTIRTMLSLRGLGLMMKTNWVGWVVTAIGVLGQFVFSLAAAKDKMDEARGAMPGFKRDLGDLNVAFGAAASEAGRFRDAILAAEKGTKERAAAIRNFKQQYGQYLSQMITEESSAYAIAKAYNEVTKALRAKIALQMKEEDINSQVAPREGWAAQRREEYNKYMGQSQYNGAWLTGVVNDALAKGTSIKDLAKQLNEKAFHLSDEIVENALRQSASGTYKDIKGVTTENGDIFRQLNGQDLWRALRYATQSYSANTALNRVNAKWKPEQDLINETLAKQGEKEVMDPLLDAPDKAAARAARKAQQDEKQAMRKEMEDMQKQSTGIISKIEEWYRLQEAAINEARADGQLTEDQAAQMVTALSILKNESLSTARRAVTTGETAEWDEMKKNTLPKAMSDMTDLSVNLLKEIQEVPVEVLHKNLSKFNGDPKKVFGLDSRAFFDQMNAKAAGNEREAARLRAKLFGEAEKMLKQYELVQQATDKMQKDLETMGFVTESYEEFARRMQMGIMERPDRNLGLKASRREEIVGSYMSQYGNATPVSNTGDAKQLQDWLNEFTEGGKAKWAVGLPAISDWLKDANGHLPEIRRFYETLAEIQRTAMQREKQGGNPLTTTTEQNAQFDDLLGRRMSDKEAFSQMGMKFVGQGTIPYRINIENAQEAVEWLRDFATSGKGEMEDWAKAFPDTVGKWMKTLEEQGALDPSKTIGEQEVKSLEDALPQIKAMFYELESYASNIGSTIEKQVQAMTARNPIGIDEMRRQYEQRRQLTEQLYNDEMAKAGENAEAVAELEARKNQALIALDEQWRQEQYQIREQMGWVTLAEQYDNEVAMYQNMLNKKLISEKEFQQKKAQIQMKSGLQQAQMYNQQMSQLVDALRDYEITSTENKYDAMIQAAQANGEDTTKLEEEKEAKILEIKKKYAAAEMMMKIAEIGINTAAGIMQAWVNPGYPGAIPLTVMIAALGAAQTAMAIAEYQKAIGASVSGGAANRKVKLASGMLTYDEGNVQTVVGDDGRVYRAREQRSLPEGVSMVTEPIATRVNGQQALVGERGPEIVIGRKTTRAIQMNRPDLLRDLALIDRGITTRKVRTFDEGNISDMASAFAGQLPAPQQGQQGSEESGQLSAEDARALTAAIGVFAQTVAAMQKNGIPAKIQKYGTGGLIDEVQSGLKFVSKYK